MVAGLWQSENSADARISLAYPIEIEKLQQDCPYLFDSQETVEWDEVGELDITERGEGGYGSTGKQ